MKQWLMEFGDEGKDNFDEILSGIKKIETRAGGPKYDGVQIGDEMLFVCGDKKLFKKVDNMKYFKSVDGMVKLISFKDIMPNVMSVNEMKRIYNMYPGYNDRIKEYGIYAFYLGDI